MRIKIESIRYPFDKEVDLCEIVSRYLQIEKKDIENLKILRKSLDARRKKISWVVTLELEIKGLSPEKQEQILRNSKVSLVSNLQIPSYLKFIKKSKARVVIVGSGPAGIFSALILIKRGIKPLILERGKPVDERISDVKKFWDEGILNEESNVQFGEGGAGTFSDGKLTTRIKDERRYQVLKEFVRAGAPEEITYMHRPHLGSDRLIQIIRNFREMLLKSGAEIKFNTKLLDLKIEEERLKGIETTDGFMEIDYLFLAIGNSSRDTYEMLFRRGVAMEAKPFAVGVRIEHPQNFINLSRYGVNPYYPKLGPAEYFFTYQDKENQRGVYTFCMCPGGYVIAGSSEKETVTTNGMSNSQRNSPTGNAALVVTVGLKDFNSNHPLAGIYFQRDLEKKAFYLGGRNFKAPAQKAIDFLKGVVRNDLIECTYKPGVTSSNLEEILPSSISESLKKGLLYIDKRMSGYIQEGTLIAIETRTSAPVRILRKEKNYHSINIERLIPVGEGSGYSGGIVSSAVDGIRAAERFDLS